MLAGYAPEIDACVSCSEPPGEHRDSGATGGLSYFAPELGGLLCEECKTVSRDAFPLPPGSVERLRELLNLPMKELSREPKLEESLVRVVRSHIQSHAPAAIQPAVPRLRPGTRVRPA
jgi:DNA repair protein RecO (recombination protein O)